jgi:DNA helicase IV
MVHSIRGHQGTSGYKPGGSGEQMSNQQQEFIRSEEQRLQNVLTAIADNEKERREKIRAHDAMIRDLEKQRLNSVNPREKDKLTAEIRRLGNFDPAKYKLVHSSQSEPYFAALTINDNDPRIGQKTYLIGKQGLLAGTKSLVIDWRKAELSQLYYEYDEGEEYEEEIVGRERIGTIKQKLKYGITGGNLNRVEGTELIYEKVDGEWAFNGRSLTTQQIKENKGDYRIVDIISLISAEQFRLITKKHLGCTYLTGGAGSGKTTVALHRLSYLVFNHPAAFRPERCMVVMFNRALQGYVLDTSRELIDARTPVKTFHSWVDEALARVGNFRGIDSRKQHFTDIKKSCKMRDLLEAYVRHTKPQDNPLQDLFLAYSQPRLGQQHLGESVAVRAFQQHYQSCCEEHKFSLDFADKGILLRLIQLRSVGQTIETGLNWFDHIIIDEAQDLSRIELDCLTAASSEKKSLTLCADTNQRILDFLDDGGFPSFKADLTKTGLDSTELTVSYRSTAQIMALASRVSGRPATRVIKEGPEPRHHSFQTREEAEIALYRAIRALLRSEPKSLTAIVCRYKNEAQELYAKLKTLAGVRLETKTFNFKPGVIITNVHQVKGLEFSGVILWNPSPRNYPNTTVSKNLLYVAITRASERLATYAYQPLSPLFPTR